MFRRLWRKHDRVFLAGFLLGSQCASDGSPNTACTYSSVLGRDSREYSMLCSTKSEGRRTDDEIRKKYFCWYHPQDAQNGET